MSLEVLMKSYINLFRNYANFSGFLKRGSYWSAMIIHWLILALPLVPGIFYFMGENAMLPDSLNLAKRGNLISRIYVPWILPIWFAYYLLMIIPVLSASVRRMHSLPKSGWWLLVGLIPVVGWFIVLIWLLQKGNYEDFLKRLKRARGENDLYEALDDIITVVNKPRNGGWFFAVLALLAVGGFFLNRQVQQSGTGERVLSAFYAMSGDNLTAAEQVKTDVIAENKAEPVQLSDEIAGGDAAVMEAASSDAEKTAAAAEALVTAEEAEPVPADETGESPQPANNDTNGGTPLLGIAAKGAGNDEEAKADEETVQQETQEGESSEAEEPVSGFGLEVEPGQPVINKRDESILLPVENMLASVYAVTVGQYEKCVEDDFCEMPAALYAEAYPEMEGKADKLPMVSVSNSQAAAYCEWAGMRLPKISEWRKAAESPEGMQYTASNANVVGTNRRSYIHDSTQQALTIPVTVFRSGASVYGMVQMAGNVWEWAETEDEKIYAALGGAWNSYPTAVGQDAIMEALPGYSADNIGFRCFADPAQLDPNDFEVSETDVEVLLNPGLWAEKGVRAKDNAQMVLIDSASFNMGVPNEAIDEKPVHEVTLSSYWIDVFEITNEQYALCIAEGACTEPHEIKSLRQASYFGNPAFNYYPIIAVDKDQAAAYCEWAGGRLPTEAEWEYAAKGVEGNLYPWGSTFIADKLNYSGNGNYDTLAVNANPEDVSSFGVYNLGGNVSEWVSDRYQEDWYTVTKQTIDPTGPEIGNYYVIRGGSAQTGENNARTADRFFALGSSYSLDRGFRCAVPDAE